MEEVAHVSKTFDSPKASFLHLGQVFFVCKGSTGSSDSFGKIISPHSHFQIGIGTPKCLSREIDQSHSSPLTQLSYLLCINSGCLFILFPCSISFFFLSRILI